MISKLIFNLATFDFKLLIFCTLFITTPIAIASQDKDTASATAQKTREIEIHDTYAEYLEEDKLLNIAYQALAKSLDKNRLSILRQAQRRWIKWRDAECHLAQGKANRKLGAFGSSVRDDCLLTLTEERNLELNQFIKNTDEATKKKFDFSRKNKYLEDE